MALRAYEEKEEHLKHDVFEETGARQKQENRQKEKPGWINDRVELLIRVPSEHKACCKLMRSRVSKIWTFRFPRYPCSSTQNRRKQNLRFVFIFTLHTQATMDPRAPYAIVCSTMVCSNEPAAQPGCYAQLRHLNDQLRSHDWWDRSVIIMFLDQQWLANCRV